MTCTNCSAAVERVLHGARGVRRANVALTLGEARVAYDPACTDEVGPCSLVQADACARTLVTSVCCLTTCTPRRPRGRDLPVYHVVKSSETGRSLSEPQSVKLPYRRQSLRPSRTRATARGCCGTAPTATACGSGSRACCAAAAAARRVPRQADFLVRTWTMLVSCLACVCVSGQAAQAEEQGSARSPCSSTWYDPGTVRP